VSLVLSHSKETRFLFAGVSHAPPSSEAVPPEAAGCGKEPDYPLLSKVMVWRRKKGTYAFFPGIVMKKEYRDHWIHFKSGLIIHHLLFPTV
jgi:hypothetical protein